MEGSVECNQTRLFAAVTSQPLALRPRVGDVNVLDGHHKSLIRDNFQRRQGGPWNGAIEDRSTGRQGLADRQPSVRGHGSFTRNT